MKDVAPSAPALEEVHVRSCFGLAFLALAVAVGGASACRRDPAANGVPDDGARVPARGTNSSHHEELCRPERYEGFASDFPCTFDSECVPCECRPVNRAEHARLGGDAWCERFNRPPAREECIATNPACCDGRCVLAR